MAMGGKKRWAAQSFTWAVPLACLLPRQWLSLKCHKAHCSGRAGRGAGGKASDSCCWPSLSRKAFQSVGGREGARITAVDTAGESNPHSQALEPDMGLLSAEPAQ